MGVGYGVDLVRLVGENRNLRVNVDADGRLYITSGGEALTTDIGEKVTDELSQTEGGQVELRVSDDNTQQTLTEILKELKIMNMHLALMTDTRIDKGEVM